MDVEQIVAAIRAEDLFTRELVRITYALAKRGKNTTSVLGQYVTPALTAVVDSL